MSTSKNNGTSKNGNRKSGKTTHEPKKAAVPTANAPILAVTGAEAEVGLLDSIARNRACAPVDAKAIPAAPAAYQPTKVDVRRRVLRVISEELHSEAVHALEEIVANRETFQKDLGELSPSPEPAERLEARLTAISATLTSLENLAQFHREIEDIALSDTVQLLEAAYKEYEHRVDRLPLLAKRYPALVRFFQARSAAISAGMDRSKADKAARSTTAEVAKPTTFA